MLKEQNATGERLWQPARVSQFFGISKSTLFRWERDGRISPPQLDRCGHRWYTREHMQQIYTLILRRKHQG